MGLNGVFLCFLGNQTEAKKDLRFFFFFSIRKFEKLIN